MALIGKIVKSAISVGQQLRNPSNPRSAQREALRDLLSRAKDTAFGKYYDFESILESDDVERAYAASVPLHDYHALADRWWFRQREGAPDITWPGRTQYFARTSGTTGGPSKYIPVTDDLLQAIRRTGLLQALSLDKYDLPEDLFEAEVLMLGSSTALDQERHYKVGEISGISADRIPGWFDNYYRPGKEIAQIDDWNERVERIAEEAPKWDIGALSGIPSWVQLMLERIIAKHGLKNIHELWPNLSVYTTGGVAFEPYRKPLEKLLARPLIYLDTYLASEGFVAYQARPNDDMAMRLAYEGGLYFEFIPFNEENFPNGEMKPDAEVLPLAATKTGEEYALLLTTCAGLWRYLIGDTVRVTDQARGEIIITGRTKHFLSVTGEQLSVDNMNEGIEQLANQMGVAIPEFVVAALPDGDRFLHRWYLGTEGSVENEPAAEQLDNVLKSLNRNYGVARSKALHRVEVRTVDPGLFRRWHEQRNKLGGQSKTPRVMPPDQFEEWEAFVAKQRAEATSV